MKGVFFFRFLNIYLFFFGVILYYVIIKKLMIRKEKQPIPYLNYKIYYKLLID